MVACECPGCQTLLDIEGCSELDIVECPACKMQLEIVSVSPPIIEESLEEIQED